MRPRGFVGMRSGALLGLVLLAGCGQAPTTPSSPAVGSAPPTTTVAPTGTVAAPASARASVPAPAGIGASLPACPDDASWRCGTVSVPVDRSDPSLGTIPVHFYVHAHTDATQPPREPIFVSPGGPGASIWHDHFYLPLSDWEGRHDTVLVEPRGVGASGLIDCPAIQGGVASEAELRAATRACAAALGKAADRYGSGDVALDVEDVRTALDVPAFDYYAASYGTVVEQAYAVRFPNRLHALVLDSGVTMTDAAHTYIWGVGLPAGWIRVATLLCSRDASCAAAYPAPAARIEALIRRVATHPVRSPNTTGPLGKVVVDEAAMQIVLGAIGPRGDQVKPADLLAAATALDRGDPSALLQLAAPYPIWPGSSGVPVEFSAGDNLAALCNDGDFVWDRVDPVAVRERKLKAAIAAFPSDTFAPFTTAGWAAGAAAFLDQCLDWPAPRRFEPVIPVGAAFPSLPTLIMSGDVDTNLPTELSRTLQTEFPAAPFMVIAGAGHDSAAPSFGSCGGKAVAQFLDTLHVDPGVCSVPGA